MNSPINSSPARPKPFTVNGLSYGVVRGPNAAGEWYWRARNGDGVTVWTGWATRAALVLSCQHIEPKAAPQLRTIEQLLDLWLDARANDPQLKAGSWECYARRVRALSLSIGALPLAELGHPTMDRARTGLAARGISPRGIVQHQRTLRAAVVWATEQGLLPPTLVPIDRATGAPKARRDHTPTHSEAAAVIGLLDGDTRLAVTVMAVTGARVSEVTTLRRSAIDLRGGWLHLNGKTGPRRFPLVPELRALLAPRADRSEAPVFVWPVKCPNLLIHRQLLAACSRLGQPEFTAHGLRRMVVNSLLRAGADIKATAELMGHTAEVMLKHYRRVSNDDKVAGVSKAGLGVPLVAKGGAERRRDGA